MENPDVSSASEERFDLSLGHMTEFMRDLRRFGDAPSMEAAAQRVVSYLYDHLIDPSSGQRICALVRLFKTHPVAQLDAVLRQWALDQLGGGGAVLGLRCLTLMATRGERPEWNDRRASTGHQAIPLVDEAAVAGIPMIARLIDQLGLPVGSVLRPDPSFLVDAEERTFNVFHVPEALGSPYIPAQDEFVRPHGVRSVVGYGGLLPGGDLFTVIFFSKARISKSTAEMFKPLALSTKVSLLPHVGRRLMEAAPGTDG